MTSYKQAGVDRNLGDLCSQTAYFFAKKTFASRHAAKIGKGVVLEGGFTGLIDMGNFYLTQNEDGVGTKMLIADLVGDYSTVGYDLCAMVADDAVCAGAEVISISNTIDADRLSKKIVAEMMASLSKACREQKIIIPGGEIAELKGMVKSYVWNATAVGIIEKKKYINGSKIKAGDPIIGLYSPNFRSNGFTLLRYILERKFGKKWYLKKFDGNTWGKIALKPSVIYHNAILNLHGRFSEKSKVKIKGIAHITGGGLYGNAPRIFGRNKKKLKIVFDNLPKPPKAMLELKKLGNVSSKEAYETWNMGIGMILIADNPEKTIALLKKQGLHSQIIGEAK